MVCRHDATQTCDECGWVLERSTSATQATEWDEYVRLMGVHDAPPEFLAWLRIATNNGFNRYRHFGEPMAVRTMLAAFNEGRRR